VNEIIIRYNILPRGDSVNIGICDDDVDSQKVLMGLCEQYYKEREEDFKIRTFQSGTELVKSEETLELLFLDMELGDMTGFDVRNYLESNHKGTYVVFVTGYEKYREDSYDVNVVGFLKKPVSFFCVKKIIDKVEKKNKSQKVIYQSEHIMLKAGDVLYVQSDNVYSTVYLKNGKQETIRVKISDFEKQLKNVDFWRIHSRYLVNLKYVRQLEESVKDRNSMIYIADEKLPIAKLRQKGFWDAFWQYRNSNSRYVV
jgi:DNA-binding LytR/AlgR family response regulator